jgi:hypothetical protein
MKKLLYVSALMLASLAIASAQQGVVNVVSLNGMPVAVPVFVQQGLGDIARGGNGAVLIDPALLSMPYEFQQFVLAHEAAHAIGIANETMADRYAGQMLRMAGFGQLQMQVVFNSMSAFLGSWGDATHLPAQSRIQVVVAAYNGQ